MNKAFEIASTPFRFAGRGLKAAALAVRYRLPSGGSWEMGLRLGRDRYNYASAVGDGRGNSIVSAAVLWVQRAFPQAPITVAVRTNKDEVNDAPEHALSKLLRRPNDFYGEGLLWMATVADVLLDGNGYWQIWRGRYREPVALVWIPSYLIAPHWPQDGSVFVDYYDYKPQGRPERIDVEDIVHFRYGIDPSNIRKGQSPIAAQLREIFTDDEASSFTATILRNLGMPGLVISPKDAKGMTQKQAEHMKQNLVNKFGGERRGEPFVSMGSLDVATVGWSPQQIDVKKLRSIPEERVCSAIGINPGLLGLGGSSVTRYGNILKVLKQEAWENAILPLHRMILSELMYRLVPEFGDPATIELRFDTSKVPALQEDRSELYTDADKAVTGGWMTVGRAMGLVGLPHGPQDEYYIRSNLTSAVPGDGFQPLPGQPSLLDSVGAASRQRPQRRLVGATALQKALSERPVGMSPELWERVVLGSRAVAQVPALNGNGNHA